MEILDNKDWEIAKKNFIDSLPDDNVLREIAKEAFNGKPFFQDKLAEWLEQNERIDEAKMWHKKAQIARKQFE